MGNIYQDCKDNIIQIQQAEIARLGKDAARYQWLRSGCEEGNDDQGHICLCFIGEDMDNAIDSAMQQEEVTK
jgi:hypothetical protein